jgi:hypothetical protein
MGTMARDEKGKDQKSKPILTFVATHPLVVLTLLAATIYAFFRRAYGEFYGSFGVRPEEVGLGYTETLSESVPGLVILALPLFLLASLFITRSVTMRMERRYERAAKAYHQLRLDRNVVIDQHLAEQRDLAAQMETLMADLNELTNERTPHDSSIRQFNAIKKMREADQLRARLGEVQAKIKAELENLHKNAALHIAKAMEEPEEVIVPGPLTDLRHAGAQVFSILIAVPVAILVMTLLFWGAEAAAANLAMKVRDGSPTNGFKPLGITLLTILTFYASPASLTFTDADAAIEDLEERAELLYLGESEGTQIFYDANAEETLRVPIGSAVVHVQD